MAENKPLTREEQMKEVMELFEAMIAWVEKERPVAWQTLYTQLKTELETVMTPILASAILIDRSQLIGTLWKMFLPAILIGNVKYVDEMKALISFAENCALEAEGTLPVIVNLTAERAVTRAFFELLISTIGTQHPFVDEKGTPVPTMVAQAATIKSILTTIYQDFEDDKVFDRLCAYFGFFSSMFPVKQVKVESNLKTQ